MYKGNFKNIVCRPYFDIFINILVNFGEPTEKLLKKSHIIPMNFD